MLPEHAPLSWKVLTWSQGPDRECRSPAMQPHAGVLPEKLLQRLLTILQDLLLGWALTLFSARAILHLCPLLARNPVDLNPDSDHMDLTSRLGLGFTSSPHIHVLTSAFGWRLSTGLPWLPSSGTADLAVFGVMVLCLPCCLDLPPLWGILSLPNDKSISAIMMEAKNLEALKIIIRSKYAIKF